jgi:HlyD family secretion protein
MAAGALSVLRRAPATPPAQKDTPPPLPPEVSLPGIIQARHVVPVAAQVSGEIELFLVDVGQEVYEGQLLAKIMNGGLESASETAMAAVDNAQARLSKVEAAIISARLEASRSAADASRSRSEFERTEKIYKRQQFLYSQGATPRLVYEKAQREFEAAEAEYRSLQDLASQTEARASAMSDEAAMARRIVDDKMKQLEDARTTLQQAEVHSPVSGIVVARNGEAGQQLPPQVEGKELFRIAVDLGALQVTLEPEPPVMARLKPGMPAMVFVAELPDGLSGSVAEIKDGRVLVDFASPNPIIKPGMTAQVRIKVG